MPATSSKTPREIVEELCAVQGRRKDWLARRAGMTLAQLSNKLAGRYGYAWTGRQREDIAEALGVPLTYIWRDTDAATAD